MAKLFASLVYLSRKNGQNWYLQDSQLLQQKTRERNDLVYHKFRDIRANYVLLLNGTSEAIGKVLFCKTKTRFFPECQIYGGKKLFFKTNGITFLIED